MAKRLTRADRAEDTRRRLLGAARRVFLRRGYQAATLDEVAGEAGFTKGAVYSRFGSKADLFLALVEQHVEARVGELRSLRDAPEPLPVAGSRQWAARMRQDPAWSLLLIEFRLHAARTPAVNRRYAAIHRRLWRTMAELVDADARRTGVRLGLPAEDAARAILALGTGALLERCADGAGLSDAAFEAANAALARGLGRPATADADTDAPAASRRRSAS
jgi:AcrR family transcriptional regulator